MIVRKKAANIVRFVRGSLGYKTDVSRTLDAGTALGTPMAMETLARKAVLWAHRMMSLNAQVAASIDFRLFLVERDDVMRRSMLRAGVGRTLDVHTRHWLQSGHDQQVGPSQHVKAIARTSMENVVELVEHPLLDLLRKPNAYHGGFSFREGVYYDLNLFGRGYLLIVGQDTPEELWRLMPQRTRIVASERNFVDGFRYGLGEGQEITYRPDEVVWVKLFDPRNPWGGLSPTEAFFSTLESSEHIATFQNWLMRRGGSPDYCVKTKGKLDQDAKSAFRRGWQRMYGSLFGRLETVVFLEGEGELERIGQTNHELEFTESSKDIRDAIAIAYGVPRSVLTSDDVNLANAKVGQEQHVRNGVWPLVLRFEDAVNLQLTPLWSDDLFLCHTNPIKEDAELQLRKNESHLKTGWTVDEIRRDSDVPPLGMDGSDVPLISTGMMPVEGLVKEEPVDETESPEATEDGGESGETGSDDDQEAGDESGETGESGDEPPSGPPVSS